MAKAGPGTLVPWVLFLSLPQMHCDALQVSFLACASVPRAVKWG